MRTLLYTFLIILLITSTLSSPAEAQVGDNKKDSLKREKKALKQAQKIRKKLLQGGDFHQLAEKYSDDPGSVPYGGELGSVHFGQFVPEFKKLFVLSSQGKSPHPFALILAII